MMGAGMQTVLILALATTTSEVTGNLASQGSVNISQILNNFQVGYDRRVRPNYGGIPVTVGVTMFILSIGDLSEKFMDFTFDMYFRQNWLDPRLTFDKQPDLDKLMVGAEYINLIWVPDTFFVNEKIALFHQATTENQYLRIMWNGEVKRSMRLTIKATCPMNLANFPLDTQTCTVEIESFGYTMADLKYAWADGPTSVQMDSTVALPQFNVLGHRQRLVEVSLSSGNYSRLLADVIFTRSMGYYMIQVYIPSSLIVVMSWVSFWLNRGAAPARVGLGVTTVLTMTTLINSVNAALPKISYMKSIDIYLFVCFFMVFGALIEYACVGYTDKRIKLRQTRYEALKKLLEEKKAEAEKLSLKHSTEPAIDLGHPAGYSSSGYHSRRNSTRTPRNDRYKREDSLPRDYSKERREHGHTNGRRMSSGAPLLPSTPTAMVLPPAPPNRIMGMRASDIDKYSRVIFPVMFSTFHLMYWTIYMAISGDEIPDEFVPLLKPTH